jgi:hypothetical protein
MKIAVYWDEALCSLVGRDECYISGCCLHLQGVNPGGYLFTELHGITSQKKVIFTVIVTGIGNLEDGTLLRHVRIYCNFCESGKCAEKFFNIMWSVYCLYE